MRKIFGRRPGIESRKAYGKYPNFRNGVFENAEPTPSLAENVKMRTVLGDFFFHKDAGVKPKGAVPVQKTNLHELSGDCLVWFGHSSYLMKIEGKTFLVDPVFSGNASPIPSSNLSFKGTEVYKADDMPFIDFLVLTHDHYDHLDYDTILKLKDKVGVVICPVGVGAHFTLWGYDEGKVNELYWGESLELFEGATISCTTARHFSGRWLKRNTSLWASYVLKTKKLKIFIGGDSGYGRHFKEIGVQHGPFDLVILENGQYNKNWPYIHMLPGEHLKAAMDLNAKALLPVHNSKFALAMHHWKEPMELLHGEAEEKNFPVMFPMIGEVVKLPAEQKIWDKWWAAVR